MDNEENVVYEETYETSEVIDASETDTPAGEGLATASMICGIASIVLCCCGPVGLAALITGILAKKQGNTSGKATAGLVIGIIVCVLWVISLIVQFATPFGREYMDNMMDMMG